MYVGLKTSLVAHTTAALSMKVVLFPPRVCMASLVTGKKISNRQSRVSIRVWVSSSSSHRFCFLLTLSQKSGRKIRNVNLESHNQIMKETRIIENLVISHKMCKKLGPSLIYKQHNLKDNEEDQNLITHRGMLQFSTET